MSRITLKFAGSDEVLGDLNGNQQYEVGRAEDNDLVTPKLYSDISRYHCFFRVEPSKVSIVDRESSYGTRVNGQLIEPGTAVGLKNMSRLQLGRNLILDVLVELDERVDKKDWRQIPRRGILGFFLVLEDE